MSTIINILIPTITSSIRSIIDELWSIRSKKLKLWIPQDVLSNDGQYNQSALVALETNIKTDLGISCYKWDIGNTEILPVDKLYNYWIERYDDSQKWAILTEETNPKQTLCLFLDAQHKTELPDKWYRYKCFSDRDSIISFCAKSGVMDFALCRGARFDKAGEITAVKGAVVYKERETGYFWYFDTFHQDHYEVFDATGKHLGESNMQNGIIDKTKADKNKHLELK